MDVRIGVTYTAKELEVELGDDIDGDTLKADLAKALVDGTPLWLTDRKGRQIGVPADKVAWVEIGRPDADRHIGFGG